MDMFLTYPLELFVARNTVFQVMKVKADEVTGQIHILITFLLVTVTALIGVSTCNLGLVFDLTGGIAASAIAFIFPAAATIKLQSGRWIQVANLPYLACIAFGCLVLTLTTATTIFELYASPSESYSCRFINF